MKNQNNSFHYYISPGRYTISDLEYCASSEHTIDINIYAIANNSKLLDLLHLFYMCGNYGVTYTYKTRAEWFCGYLAAFIHGSDKYERFYNKALIDPIVRLLIVDESLLEKVKKIL